MTDQPDHMTAWIRFDEWIKKAIELRGSDILIVPRYKPQVRVNGELQALDDLTITPEQTGWIRSSLFQQGYYAPPAGTLQVSRNIGENKLADITCATAGGVASITIKLHASSMPALDDANYPAAAAMKKLLEQPNGLVIVAGPHGSGKTTTLYAMVNWINETRHVHICSVEKPRHYLFPAAKAVVQQREVGLDGNSQTELIQAAMQQDCDVIMVGDVENFDTLAACMHTAETGHLVIVQVHANSVQEAVQRLVEAAPAGLESLSKRQLHATLRGVVVQRLARKKDGRTRIALCEVIGEGARKFIDGGTPDAGFYSARAQDEIKRLEGAGEISKEEAERLSREVGA
ncbi:MAG: Flp pilus assembly complex ATPase component TadA [Planctomycetes bacterium]|nr:Flp pilus assembly complex ATPase component TadA [Planctomycetota bacterium]